MTKKTRPPQKGKNEPCVKKPSKGTLKEKTGHVPTENTQGEKKPCDAKIFEQSSPVLTPQEEPSLEEAQPLAFETNEFKIIWRKFKYFLGHFLRRLAVKFLPARAPQDYDKVDLVTGLHIRVKTSPFYVTFSVNERDFYWNRWSGKFDGTGSCFMYQHPGMPRVEMDSGEMQEYSLIKKAQGGASVEEILDSLKASTPENKSHDSKS